MSNYKSIFESIEFLNELSISQSCVIQKPTSPFDKIIAKITKLSIKGYELQITDPDSYRMKLGSQEDFIIQLKDLDLKIDQLFFNHISENKIYGKIGAFTSTNLNEKEEHYYRLIIPLKTKANFTFYIDNTTYRTKRNISAECITLKLNNHTFDFYQYSEKDGGDYLIIDSSSTFYLESFSKHCFSIIVSFGFITGYLIQNEGYYFAYDNKELKETYKVAYRIFRNTIKSSYEPIYNNSYGPIHDNNIAEKYYKKTRRLRINEFEKLCSKIHLSADWRSCLLLFTEASTLSLLTMPGCFSITLESLANLINNENEKNVLPIKNKTLAKKIRTELKKKLEEFRSDLCNEAFGIIKNKIEQINQRTNRERLLIPFKVLNINLNDRDIEAIEHRNDFLHGRQPEINSEILKNSTDSSKYLYYLSLKLYTLISALVLKYVGYDNLIVNYPKIHENFTNIKIDEEYYRQI